MDEPKQDHEEQAEEQTEGQENEQDLEGQAFRHGWRQAEDDNPKDEGEGYLRISDRCFKGDIRPLAGVVARLRHVR